MATFSRNDVVLVRLSFSDLSDSKIRPAVVVSAAHASRDLIVVGLTSKTAGLRPGEFVLEAWKTAGLNVSTAVKRTVATVEESLIVKHVGQLASADAQRLDDSLRTWLGL